MPEVVRAAEEPGAGPEDVRLLLGSRLLAYVFTGLAVFMLLSLAAGEAGTAWPVVLGLFIAQAGLSLPFILLLARHRYFAVANVTLATINFSAHAAILVAVGGYPTPFWIMALFGVYPATFFLGQAGIIINAAVTGGALLFPHRAALDPSTIINVGAFTAVLVVIGVVTKRTFELLLEVRTQQTRAEHDLSDTNVTLQRTLRSRQAQMAQQATLATMSDLMQSCTQIEETFPIMAHGAQDLLPEYAGALFLYSASRDSLEAVVTWGGLDLATLEHFAPSECWALRRGRPHASETGRSAVSCPHVVALQTAARVLCVPLTAQGEVLGVLQLESQAARVQGTDDDPEDTRDDLAEALARQLALPLASLRLRETLRNQAIRDPLTHLYNRRYLEETLAREARRARQHGAPLAVAMIDIDRFKVFNDTHGHEAGDDVLQEIGVFLRRQTRPEDIACRFGGEEFVIVLVDTSLEDAVRRLDDLRERVGLLAVRHHGRNLGSITISAGVAALPECEEADLLKAADVALYRAKEAGRNRVVAAEQRGALSVTREEGRSGTSA